MKVFVVVTNSFETSEPYVEVFATRDAARVCIETRVYTGDEDIDFVIEHTESDMSGHETWVMESEWAVDLFETEVK